MSGKFLGLLLQSTRKVIFNHKSKAVVIMILAKFIFSSGLRLKVTDRLILNISPVKTPFSLLKLYDNPILNLSEGLNGEIIIARGSFFEIFDRRGNFLKKVGGLGEGPGDFRNIIFVKAYRDKYYILDFPNLMNVFDIKFKFNKRFYLQGKGTSPFVFDFEISGGQIFAAQFWRAFMGGGMKEVKDKVISVYNLNGKFQKAIFNFSYALTLLGNEAYLNPTLCTFNDLICLAFLALNRIWVIDREGNIIKVKTFGIKSWKNIPYSAKREEQLRKKGLGPAKIFAWFMTRGSWIYDVNFYRGYILINALKNKESKGMNLGISCIYIFDEDFKEIEPPISLEGYFLAGVGKRYIYFVRYLQSPSTRSKTKIEVKRCVLEKF